MIRHFFKGLTFSGISYYLLQDQIISQTYRTNQTLKSLTQEFNQINSFDENLRANQPTNLKPYYESNLKEKIQFSWNKSLYELHSKVYNLDLGELFESFRNLNQVSSQSNPTEPNKS